jgi:hypothetical protein
VLQLFICDQKEKSDEWRYHYPRYENDVPRAATLSKIWHTPNITRFIYAHTRQKRDSTCIDALHDRDVTVLLRYIVNLDVPFLLTSFYDVIHWCVRTNDKGIITVHAICYHLFTGRRTEKTHKRWKREYVNQNGQTLLELSAHYEFSGMGIHRLISDMFLIFHLIGKQTPMERDH